MTALLDTLSDRQCVIETHYQAYGLAPNECGQAQLVAALAVAVAASVCAGITYVCVTV